MLVGSGLARVEPNRGYDVLKCIAYDMCHGQ